ncbi:MAG: DNA adenine methylase [Firmicutes bacterium]|nr:DNA adenine methylase [Bacillota bacterium]
MKGSILRYPGGKAKLYPKIKKIAEQHKLMKNIYVEPFAGGFGIGLRAMHENLFTGYVINDVDYHVYAFWVTLFNHTDELIELIDRTPINMESWKNQKKVYCNYDKYTLLEVGFSFFFLNRSNYSGVLTGGPIGGINQEGQYKIDCRFSKDTLIKNITAIAEYRDNVEIYNLDARDFIINVVLKRKDELLIYFDPPYVRKGKILYTNFYETHNHIELQRTIFRELDNVNWIMTYDDCELIRELYFELNPEKYQLSYAAGIKKTGNELFIKHVI